jgi:hypothetical protein
MNLLISQKNDIVRLGVLTLCIAGTVFTASLVKAEAASGWSRGILAEPTGTDRTYELSLGVVRRDKRQFNGTWLYANYDRKHALRFEATKDQVGILWPKVKLEVQDGTTGRWVRIAPASIPGKKITVTVRPGSNVDLFVELDPFSPFINKSKFGRIILTNGQASEFQLKYLLPPQADG